MRKIYFNGYLISLTDQDWFQDRDGKWHHLVIQEQTQEPESKPCHWCGAVGDEEHGCGEVTDNVNHPSHYCSHPSGIEVITITEHMNFCLGNAIKYIMRAGYKNDQLEDLRKAEWYINREIERLQRRASTSQSK